MAPSSIRPLPREVEAGFDYYKQTHGAYQRRRKQLYIIAAVLWALSLFVAWRLVVSSAWWDNYVANPGFGECRRCGFTWATVKKHETGYGKVLEGFSNPEINIHARACFPLCETCWESLTPEQRLPYYLQLWRDWESRSPGYADWKDIEEAVLEGR